jgi:hypothetical protein
MQVAVTFSKSAKTFMEQTCRWLVDHGDQHTGGVVEHWFAAWAAGGPPGSTVALFGVALLGAGGLGRGEVSGQPRQFGAGHAGQPGVGQPVEHGSSR